MSWTLFKDWVELKKEAVKSEDFSLYQWFLNEAKKEFTKLYIDLKKPKVKKMIKRALGVIASEIDWVKLKLKGEVPF